jgi:hypothetical protein
MYLEILHGVALVAEQHANDSGGGDQRHAAERATRNGSPRVRTMDGKGRTRDGSLRAPAGREADLLSPELSFGLLRLRACVRCGIAVTSSSAQVSVARLLAFERFDVREVLLASDGALVFDQGSTADDRDRASVYFEGLAVGDGLREGNTLGAIDDIDAPRRHPELEDPVIRRKVVGVDFEGGEWGAERRECRVHPACVVGVGVNQHVEILRGARVPVEGDGVAPDDDESRLRFVQLHEDVAKIVEELDHRLEARSHRRERGTNRTGISSRRYAGAWLRARLKLSRVSRVKSEMAAAPFTGEKSIGASPSLPLWMLTVSARRAARCFRANSS